ncbi:MAG: pyridoxamine 5'-phosphate oxidase family protein [Chloroflexi bacterium]|nr:pyridoxamine 5'-phosphate oxidase family protein [Chloroflexota bacterium]
MAIEFTDEMRELIGSAMDDRLFCTVGTASKDGVPNISLKGSVAIYDGETLSYWERTKRSALDNVSENPNIVIFYRNPGKRINWRFHGKAAIYESGGIRDKVKSITPQAELDRDPELAGVAVLVKVDAITDLGGNVLQTR